MDGLLRCLLWCFGRDSWSEILVVVDVVVVLSGDAVYYFTITTIEVKQTDTQNIQ